MITRIELHEIEIPLLAPFVTAVRSARSVRTVLVELVDDEGRHGWGEAPANWRVTGESPESIAAACLGPLWEVIAGREVDDALPGLARELAAAVRNNAGARSGVECALHDLAARRRGVSVASFLGGNPGPVRTDMTLSVGGVDDLVERAHDLVSAGISTLKVKVGSLASDRDALPAVRQAVGPGVRLRVDANQGWARDEAIAIVRHWEAAGVDLEFVEQPVRAGALDDLAAVTAAVDTPILADESVWTADDAYAIASRRAADALNVKLAKTGGLTEAMRIAGIAADAGLRVLVGCMMESQVGITAAASLAAALPDQPHGLVHDLDAGAWLAGTPISGGATHRDDRIELPSGPGFGIDGVRTALRLRHWERETSRSPLPAGRLASDG